MSHHVCFRHQRGRDKEVYVDPSQPDIVMENGHLEYSHPGDSNNGQLENSHPGKTNDAFDKHDL